MWKVIETEDYARQAKWYARKKRREFDAVIDNLADFLTWLEAGHRPRPFAFGFLHDESAEIIAIDQRGASSRLAATQLYLYAYVERETIFLLTIGDKRSQNNDVKSCKRAVETINAEAEFRIQRENEADGG